MHAKCSEPGRRMVGYTESLNVDSWGDNERTVWGILLTDVVRHVANALHDAKGWDKVETAREIRRVFNAELDGSTADPSGQFHTH